LTIDPSRQALGCRKLARDQRRKSRNYRGFDPDGVADTEADHFGNCPVCGALVDMRDLGQILALLGALNVLKGCALLSLPHSVPGPFGNPQRYRDAG
jgi:hypothetical protein